MRRLNAKDVFAFSRVLKKANIKEVLKNLQENVKNVSSDEEMGFALISSVLEMISYDETVEDAFYKFIARPLEMDVESIADMSLLDLCESIKTLIELEDKESWKAFLQSLASTIQ